MSELITIATLADRLHVDRRTIQRRMKSGRLGIPVLDLSNDPGRRQPRFRITDVEAYLRSREVQ